MIVALVRITFVGAVGLAMWRFTPLGRGAGWCAAWIGAQMLRVAGWSPHVAWTADGVRLSLSRTDAQLGFITGTVPLGWSYLLTLTVGVVLFITLVQEGGGLLGGTPKKPSLRRIVSAFGVLLLLQGVAVALLVAGSVPGGAPPLQRVADILTTGVGLVLPALAWAWTIAPRRP